MIHQIVNKWRQILPHGVLEQTGVLLWVISVLVIGLRLTLIVPDQPIFLNVLQLSVTMLTAIAVLGGGLTALSVVAYLLRSSGRSSGLHARPRHAGHVSGNKQRTMKDRLGSLTAFTVDSLLAATIIRTAIGWAEQSSLNARHIAYLVGLATLHITLAVLHEHRFRD